jgi:glycosyltransferase involved in cell wall biosynthesis
MMVRRRPISVTYDDQAFVLQRRGGISRYYVELIRAFEAGDGSVLPILPMRFTLNEHLLELDPQRFHRPPAALARQPVMRFANRLVAGRRATPDVLHHTFYFGNPSRLKARSRFVTVYDMIPEIFPAMFGEIRPHAEKSRYLDVSDGIICISEQTKADLLRICGRPRAPVFVVPLGVSRTFSVPTCRLPGLPWPYLLYIGQRNFYKDFEVVLRGFEILAERHSELRLVCVGGEPWTGAEISTLPGPASERVIHIRPTDQDLPAIYQHARAYVSASRYEGFGLPVLEALAARAPTVISDIGSHREVAAEAAHYFQPGSPEHLADEVEAILRIGHTERARAADLSTKRAAAFTWASAAARTEDAYRSVL